MSRTNYRQEVLGGARSSSAQMQYSQGQWAEHSKVPPGARAKRCLKLETKDDSDDENTGRSRKDGRSDGVPALLSTKSILAPLPIFQPPPKQKFDIGEMPARLRKFRRKLPSCAGRRPVQLFRKEAVVLLASPINASRPAIPHNDDLAAHKTVSCGCVRGGGIAHGSTHIPRSGLTL